jgi:hypothetical protein
MSKPAPVQPTRPGAAEADDSDLPVTPEVERIVRERLETFDIPTNTRRSSKTFEGPTFASSNTASGYIEADERPPPTYCTCQFAWPEIS